MIRALFALAILLVPALALGQIVPSLGSSAQIQIIPGTPEPGTSVLLIAENVSDKNTLSFTWTANGKVIAEGIGADRATITAGRVGESTTVTVRIADENGTVAEISRTLLPATLDLVWEGNTYTPPFYLGRPLPTGESTVTVSALPDIRVGGTRVAKENLVYEWYLNNNDRPYRSGYGLHTITLAPPLFDSAFTVSVTAKTRNSAGVARDSVVITPTRPDVILYEQGPLLGTLFNKAATDEFVLDEEEVTFRLFPFFVVDPTAPNYVWSVAGSLVDPGSVSRELTLRKTAPGQGRYTIEASLETAGSLYEQAARSLQLIF